MTKCNNCNRQIEDWVTGDLCARCFGELEREKSLSTSQVKLVDVITYDGRILVAVLEHDEIGLEVAKALDEIVKEIRANYEMTEQEVRDNIKVEIKELNHIHWEDLAGEV